ncbi:unnamed protein product [Linum trigynum]|uniref:histidine--tRNA ligase n=1 Tax=Linum trigynum TaxID=586398 RepID=A0AAV2D2Z0_9ROSI
MYGFEDVDFLVLESEALFIGKAGEENRGQLYCFEDRWNLRVALRPELAPSLAMLVIRKGKPAPLPLKWFAVGHCWQYERMTRKWTLSLICDPVSLSIFCFVLMFSSTQRILNQAFLLLALFTYIN